MAKNMMINKSNKDTINDNVVYTKYRCMDFRATNRIYNNGEIEELWNLETYATVHMPDGSVEERWREPYTFMSGKDNILRYDNNKHCFFTLIRGTRYK